MIRIQLQRKPDPLFHGWIPNLPDLAYQGRAGFEGQLAWLPTGGGGFFAARGAHVLEGLDLAHRLGKAPAHRRRHHFHRLHDTIGVDNKPSADIDAAVFIVHPVDLADGPGAVGHHRPGNAAFSHFGEFFLVPDFVDEGTIDAYGHDLDAELLKLIEFAGDRRQFGGSNKGEITRIKTDQDPFTQVIG